jgi:hypothetical protein
MRRTALALGVVAAGGCKGDRTFPMWQDGILVEGDCEDDYEIVDGTPTNPVQQIPNPLVPGDPASTDPLWHMDGMPDLVGTVVTDAATQQQLWNETMNWGSWPIVDWTTQQAVHVWARNPQGCGLTIEEFHVNTTADLSVVLDVTFNDPALNCANPECTLDSKAIVMVGIDKELDAKLCRRIKPGCEPSDTEVSP